MKKIVSLVRRAVEDYDMIADGDKIAVGVSGGKDSLVLLRALASLSRYYPKRFSVMGITLDMGFGADYSEILKMCEELGIEYIIKKTDIKEIVFDVRNEASPCSLCSKMRRGALNDLAVANGCNRVALGHHNDDVLDTFMLSLLYEGRINCFTPVTYLDRTNVYSIRPLIYVPEKDIRGVVKKYNIPVTKSFCPADGETKRAYVGELIKRMEQETHPGLKKRMFTAVTNSKIEGWQPVRKSRYERKSNEDI